MGVADAILDVTRWAHGLGPAGAIAFAVLYAAAAVAFVPGSVLTLAAGFLWGPVWGVVVVAPASWLAAAAAFALGRTLLRPAVERRLHRWPRAAAIDRAIGDRPVLVVALLRLSPIVPFVVANYALALSRVRFAPYLVASAVGMLPATVAYVYAGSAVSQLAAIAGGGGARPGRWLFWLGLVATVALAVWLARTARRALSRALEGAA